MVIQHPQLPKVADPKYSNHFDAWNTSATGHQRAENRASSSLTWRDVRTTKLAAQLQSSGGERRRIYAGEHRDERHGRDIRSMFLASKGEKWRKTQLVQGGSEDLGGQEGQGGGSRGGERRRRDDDDNEEIGVSLRGVKNGRNDAPRRTFFQLEESEIEPRLAAPVEPQPSACREQYEEPETTAASFEDLGHDLSNRAQDAAQNKAPDETPCRRSRRLFDGLTVYINGSTYPLISDHKLKHLLVSHGASLSIYLARRQVTHVILGKANVSAGDCGNGSTGAGGGLSARKLQKEFTQAGIKGVKYVSVEWVLQSVKAGKRLPEAQFASLRAAAQKQGSVYGLLQGDGI